MVIVQTNGTKLTLETDPNVYSIGGENTYSDG